MFIEKLPFLSNCLTNFKFSPEKTHLRQKNCFSDETLHTQANRTPFRCPTSKYTHISVPKNPVEISFAVWFALFCPSEFSENRDFQVLIKFAFGYNLCTYPQTARK